MNRLARNGLTASGVAAGYVGCAVTGTLLDMPPSNFAIIWPATAFILSVLLLLPGRSWWLCAAAVVPAHLAMAAILYPDVRLIVVTTEVLGNLALAFATAFAVRLTVAEPLFGSFGSVLRFILVAGIGVPAAINAAILWVHVATGRTADFGIAWLQWMVAGFFPTITIPPLLVLAARGGFSGRPHTPRRVQLELALLLPALFTLSFLAFGELVDTAHWPALFLAPLPLLLWAAVRTGAGGASLSLLVFAGGIIAQALRQNGPFSAHSPIEDVTSLQIFLVTVSTPLLLLAALIDERRRAAEQAHQSETRIQLAASSTSTGLWQWDSASKVLWLTDNCRTLFGLTDQVAPTPFAFLEAVHPDDRGIVREQLEGALSDIASRPAVEFRLQSPRATRWYILDTHSEPGDDSVPVLVSGVFRDITERAEARLEIERLRRRLKSLQDDERRRIAVELHDSTAQHLVAAKFGLLSLRRKVSDDVQHLVDDAYRSLREATAEIRTFTYLLHTAQVEEEGLCAILRRYVPGFERRTGVTTALRITSRADELSAELQHALLRITQESLGNLQRHAGATQAAVNLRCLGNAVHLVVCDNGKGMGPDESEVLSERLRLGLGIPDLAVRVRATRCRDCGDCRGLGTAVHVAVPLRARLPDRTDDIARLARAAQPG